MTDKTLKLDDLAELDLKSGQAAIDIVKIEESLNLEPNFKNQVLAMIDRYADDVMNDNVKYKDYLLVSMKMKANKNDKDVKSIELLEKLFEGYSIQNEFADKVLTEETKLRHIYDLHSMKFFTELFKDAEEIFKIKITKEMKIYFASQVIAYLYFHRYNAINFASKLCQLMNEKKEYAVKTGHKLEGKSLLECGQVEQAMEEIALLQKLGKKPDKELLKRAGLI